MMKPVNNRSHHKKIENYYRFHSHIYDATRWSFLFGRKTLVNMLPNLPHRPRIMEMGCGTGKNIERLKYHFPEAQILGIDLSDDMLTQAGKRLNDVEGIKLRKKKYGSEKIEEGPFDLIWLSYSLTMTGGGVEEIVGRLNRDLKPNGYVSVVDFHTSPFVWFRRWMDFNHVDLSGRLLPLLKNHFNPVETEIRKAYAGLWSYFLFVGRQS